MQPVVLVLVLVLMVVHAEWSSLYFVRDNPGTFACRLQAGVQPPVCALPQQSQSQPSPSPVSAPKLFEWLHL